MKVTVHQKFAYFPRQMNNRSGGLVVRASAAEVGGLGSDPRPSYTKRLTKMVLTAASLDAQH
jgi:hypothetical protein